MEATVSVPLPQNPYNVEIVPGGLASLGERLRSLGSDPQSPAGKAPGEKILLISNPEIYGHYGEIALASLQAAGFAVGYHEIPAGEPYKTLQSIEKIYDACLSLRLERSSTLVALGGGVIGDMTGFAAATWLRGINFVQVPTSLLAMVDASVGGKTGVNHPQGKNLIGAFYQPRLVLIDPNVLPTLPERELRAGMAEVIKYGVIWDRALFERLEAVPRLGSYADLQAAGDLLPEILRRSCQAKADVVAKDEKEGGLRAILNYGHTVGHAIESLTGYDQFVHGEAVAIGMEAAGRLAAAMGFWSNAETERQKHLLQKTQLPTAIPANLTAEEIVATCQTDKKVRAGKVRFVLPQGLGATTLCDRIETDRLLAVLRACGAS